MKYFTTVRTVNVMYLHELCVCCYKFGVSMVTKLPTFNPEWLSSPTIIIALPQLVIFHVR